MAQGEKTKNLWQDPEYRKRMLKKQADNGLRNYPNKQPVNNSKSPC